MLPHAVRLLPKPRPDYGLDYLVQLIDEDREATGVFFLAQLKTCEKYRGRGKDVRAIRVSSDNLRYYDEQCQWPVFLFGADLNTKSITYDWVQGGFQDRRIDQKLKRKGKLLVTYHLPLANQVCDLAGLKDVVIRAAKLMRCQQITDLSEAIRTLALKHKARDPRFKYEIKATEAGTTTTIHPLEPFVMKTTLVGREGAAEDAWRALIEEGKPIEASDGLEIRIEGMPNLGVKYDQLERIEYSQQHPVEVTLSIDLPDGRRHVLPEFRGKMTGGTRIQRIECVANGCPITALLEFRSLDQPAGGGEVKMTWRWDLRRWAGHRLMMLPWLDAVRDFVAAAAQDGAAMGFQLTAQGNQLLPYTAKRTGNINKLGKLLPCMELLKRARHIACELKWDTLFPDDFNVQDAKDIEELSQFISSGEVECDVTDMSFTVRPRENSKCAELEEIAKEGKGFLKFAHRAGERNAKYLFMRREFDFAEVEIIFTSWTDSSVKKLASGDMRITLRNSRVIKRWPRFYRAKEEGSGASVAGK